MIRLFVGLKIPDNIKKQVLDLDRNLAGALWKEPEKLHLTLAFVGNIEEPQAEELRQELQYVRFPAFHLSFKEIGYFTKGDLPHHLWVGVAENKALGELQEKISNIVKKLQLNFQDKFKFHPHMTLARLQGTPLSAVLDYVAKNNLFHSDEFLVDHFVLFISHARENGEGKYYTVAEEYPLSLV
ncbi:MAG: RNA 2',3'-cyclic phosphodiesterase [Alphaproteobacteria bacterium]|nr:RNA 2',3'-cyclic phosphodiesterase [Alphaproteobacteria bacterium]